ncbi:hypothetical protein [Sinomicrobium weinanense]|uniref:RNA polymerase sigma-70 region 2 domain-containing protein n=1 Tax=Sinomicrobium weinanense TaxID=2842200 RepID=A0A926Q3X1_9FLAO|nr:hypothetical protein [Sinomicrobium weinanense]MBC9796225.1 hypothetical protein [Sinomicrobium weinanense]MBU3122320.1 hypothetical protein [Sinomicrobium weinanense]
MENPEEQTVTVNTLQSLKEGDLYAREIVCRQYETRVRLYIFSLVKSKRITDEIVREICTKVWEQRKDIRPESFDSYVLALCKDITYRKLVQIFREPTSREQLWKDIIALRR